MTEKEKNSKTGLDGFLRYRGNNLSGSERNAFEKELQKDPFAMEAEEGFSLSDAGQISSDMKILNNRLKSRTSPSVRFIVYRIAASAAVLMVITTVFILIQRKSPSEQGKIADSEAISPGPAPSSDKGEKSIEIKAEKSSPEPGRAAVKKPESLVSAPIAEKREKSAEIKTVAMADSIVPAKMAKAEDAEAFAMMEEAVPDTAIKAIPAQNVAAVSEIAVPAEGEKRARIVSAATAGKSDLKKQVSYPGYKPAEPLNGMESFNKYIEGNIRQPSADVKSRNVVVEVSFIVRLNGIPDSIKAIRSPSQPFTDEAVRLIKEGPLWKPASENGALIEEKVNVKIVFR